jgi:hypothetical protein
LKAAREAQAALKLPRSSPHFPLLETSMPLGGKRGCKPCRELTFLLAHHYTALATPRLASPNATQTVIPCDQSLFARASLKDCAEEYLELERIAPNKEKARCQALDLKTSSFSKAYIWIKRVIGRSGLCLLDYGNLWPKPSSENCHNSQAP